MFGDFTIEEGVNFTINGGQLRFCDGGRLIVKNGANFHLNSTLTSTGTYKWGGVELWNDLGSYIPGKAQFTSGSAGVIENAETGIKTYGPTPAHAGGFVYATDMEFRNCNKSIEVGKASYYTYTWVRNCVFNNFNNPEFESFIDFNQVLGLSLIHI